MSVMSTPRAVSRRPSGSPFKLAEPKPIEVYEVGDRVTHDRYGVGKVICLEPDIAVGVDFGASKVRIVSPYSHMTKL